MANKFELEIRTPARCFFAGQVEAIHFTTGDGGMTVMAHHVPMIAAVNIGEIVIDTGHEKKVAVCSEGILDVRSDVTQLFLQSVEWPDEVDVNKAKLQKDMAEEALRQARSMQEYTESRAILARAISRLRVTSQRDQEL